MRNGFGLAACGAVLVLGASGPVLAADAPPAYPGMAPLAQYLMAPADEIALARSAAPASVSDGAEILVLTSHGYETAAKGTNGFVCVIERSWASGFDDAEFWNFHERGPLCMNPAAVRTVLPSYIERTQWVLSGLTRDQMLAKARTSAVANAELAPGAMCYMLSKGGYLSDAGHHWHPHIMFWVGHADAASWGANLPGSPVLGGPDGPGDPVSTFFVLVAKWSDGSSAMDMAKP